MLSEKLRKQILQYQKSEITEQVVYSRLAKKVKDKNNAKALRKIASDEKRHYGVWKSFTGEDVKPSTSKIWMYYWISRTLGLTFGLKLMEKGEKSAQINYSKLKEIDRKIIQIRNEEKEHEAYLTKMIDEKQLNHMGSIVLGLNDAIIELTGVLAGLTFSFQNTELIALAGGITGIAASFSMAASEYLSTKAEGNNKNAIEAAMYTGAAYFATVVALVSPFLILENYFISLGVTLVTALVIIAAFNFYISVAQDHDFKKRFAEMALLSLGVATISFIIGAVVRKVTGIEI